MKYTVWTPVIGAALALGACAAGPKPTPKLVDAQAAVRAADEIGAARVPQAQLHIQLAHEELQRADKLMQDGDDERAAGAVERAKADAELALALTRRTQAERELTRAQPNVGAGTAP